MSVLDHAWQSIFVAYVKSPRIMAYMFAEVIGLQIWHHANLTSIASIWKGSSMEGLCNDMSRIDDQNTHVQQWDWTIRSQNEHRFVVIMSTTSPCDH
jgi:hypothetical protein